MELYWVNGKRYLIRGMKMIFYNSLKKIQKKINKKLKKNN